MAEVRLKGIYKVYGKDNEVVRDFNLEIEDKEFIVLVGPSGCGKSTTLRMIAGLEEISKGELFIDGKKVNDVHPKDRDISMVFQNYALYPHMSVFDNMAFALKLKKLPKGEIKERVNKAAAILGIENLLMRKPRQLSGGQRQRVAIGRSIVRQPKVFLMDEPLSNLDAKLRNQMRSEIIKLHKELNTTFIYVTHDQTEAMTLGDRIVVMKDGVIMQSGTPRQVYSRPNSMFVAGFIGTPQMNFYDGELKLDAEKDQYTVTCLGNTYTLSPEVEAILKLKKQQPTAITLGIRPEHITLCFDAQQANKLTGKVDISEMLGSEMYLHLDVEGKRCVVKVHSPKDLDRWSATAEQADTVDIVFQPDQFHLFDAKTQESLLTWEEAPVAAWQTK